MFSPEEVSQTTEELGAILQTTEVLKVISQTTETLEAGPQTTEALEVISQTTEALERLPHTFEYHSASNEHQQQIVQQTQKDVLLSLGGESTTDTLAWRQIDLLREGNRHLLAAVDELRVELQQLHTEKSTLQSGFDNDVAIIHRGHQQEIAHYQAHLLELMEERNHLQEEYVSLEQRYQAFSQSFTARVDMEVQRQLCELATITDLSSTEIPAPLQIFVKAVEVKAKAEGDRFLAEALRLKREVGRMAEILGHERQQLDEERQRLMKFQQSVSDQAALRQKVLETRSRSRWQTITVLTSVGLLALLVILQFACLGLFHASLAAPVTLAILAPIVFCVLIALILASPPFQFARHVKESAPRKKKIR
ncbi:hypothetical protein [Dictyobacter arantiisoli]|uniref:Uncharacterized protein n=1 Tax=Dictyobacter arantiisoli TaxID=2014874 RepID=A0A5A5T7A4_9CHLR|nr:hypothetical protein [Dictyobacter arantiisoli]GCF07361.1 hypothetical protein KDI_09250 [Dictyobacter arantiisoli]